MVETWGIGRPDYSMQAERIPILTFKKENSNFFYSYETYAWAWGDAIWAVINMDSRDFYIKNEKVSLPLDKVIVKKIIVSASANCLVSGIIYKIDTLTDGVLESEDFSRIGMAERTFPKGLEFTRAERLEITISNIDDTWSTEMYVDEWGWEYPYHWFTFNVYGTAILNMPKVKEILEARGLSIEKDL